MQKHSTCRDQETSCKIFGCPRCQLELVYSGLQQISSSSFSMIWYKDCTKHMPEHEAWLPGRAQTPRLYNKT